MSLNALLPYILFCACDVILKMVLSAVKRWSENFSGITIFYHTHGKNYVFVMLGVYENIFRDVFSRIRSLKGL